MATLQELSILQSRGTVQTDSLFEKVKAAVLISAETIRVEPTGTPEHELRLKWAKDAFVNPRAKAEEMWGAILGANAAQTSAAILAATDAAIQSAVNSAINAFLPPATTTVL